MFRVYKPQIQSITSCVMLPWQHCNADYMYLMWRKTNRLNVLQSCTSVVVIDNHLNLKNKLHSRLNKPLFYYDQWHNPPPLVVYDISKAISNCYREVYFHITHT